MVKFSREYEASVIPEWKGAFVDYKGLKKLIKKIKLVLRDAGGSSAGDSLPETAAGVESIGYDGDFSVLDPVRALTARLAPRVQVSAEDEESGDSGELVPPTDKHEREFLEKTRSELEKGAPPPAPAFVHRKKVQHAEKNIRDAFMALYRGLELLKKFSSLNIKAFTKILKKFVKVSEQQRATDLFSQKVKTSSFSTSDKVLQLSDEVESLFLKHFAGNDRMVAMKYLNPQQRKSTHMITFLAGLFTGTFVSLFIIYTILAHASGIFASAGDTAYKELVYHVFSMFALISLHCFLYGCNLFMWKSTRINQNFIFDFMPNTALTHRDAFLMSAFIMCTVVTALVINLFLIDAGVSYPNAVPGALIVLSAGVLFCPFNVFYRSTRYCFMRIMRNIIFSPFYKVLMADFFMADQLTSQVPLLRHMEFAACYFMAGSFRANPYETCTNSQQYKHLAYVISFLPYYWRAMQCLRSYLEEHDVDQLAHAGKYMSAMVAAAVRFKYKATPTPFWVWMVLISSTGTTAYQLYWDFVKDWGFFTPKSKNLWLRDDLILKNKFTYYVSMMLNLVLRLSWTKSVMKIPINKNETRLLDFFRASLEIIRRGQWNFYREKSVTACSRYQRIGFVPILQVAPRNRPLSMKGAAFGGLILSQMQMLNLVLRLSWTKSVMKISITKNETRLLDFSRASLEIIRRGHWNFYRLENEHLNNVGKFRAVKTVPLPFQELEMY
uniref:Phosphate transporter PHO1-2 n=1 Tax=Aegilops tauschii TaxID=37682 RepID=M8B600_AEGTA